MSGTVVTRKKTRSSSRSTGSGNNTPKMNEDPNLNGLKENAKEDVEAMEVDKTEEDITPKMEPKLSDEDPITAEPKDEKPTKGRKRKANEIKSNNSISEEPPVKDKPVQEVLKNEMIEEAVKDENLGDSSEIYESSVKDNTNSDVLNSKEMVNDSIVSDALVNDTESLGKGKRARIPNKRYSDLPLKTPTKINLDSELHSNLENGEVKENVDSSGSNTDASEHSGSATASPSMASTKIARSPATSVHKKKSNIDLTNPNYLKPFHFGWKRELVYRATDSTLGKRNGDIYYYTPNGRKVRSMREVSEHLKNKELTLEDFTFTKEPLGLDDPEKEIIRDAKNKSASGTPLVKKLTPKITKTPKAISPKNAAIPSTSQEKEKEVKPKEREPKVKSSPRISSFKIKLTRGVSAKSKTDKKSKDDSEGDMELGTYPPWTPVATKSTDKTGNAASVKRKKRNSKAVTPAVVDVDPAEAKSSTSFLQNVAYGYHTLLYIFQYLKVQDLLRASCVCSMWRDVASHSLLWKTVRMKNSQIHSFEGLADALERHGTTHLDLRKMLLPSTNSDEIWQEFSREIIKVKSLKKIELCRCPAVVIEQLALSNPNLEVLNALAVKCDAMSLAPLLFVKKLHELRLKSTAGFALTSDLTALADLKELRHLSLTSIKDLNKLNIEVIADLKNLESLDLGECTDFPKTFGSEILIRLNKLEKLRLEKGQGNCFTFEILDAVKAMPHVEQLELVNFDIKAGFDKALGACKHIKKLLIIPTYISQSATTNHMVLGGVLRLQSNLSHFVWGITLELLRVTELFVDQCEDSDKKEKKEKKQTGNGDSIPVLKPVPLLKEGASLDIPPAQDPPQVEILPLPNLQKLLLQSLPTTRVKILKIPFHATWRQSITDTVN